MKQIIIGVTLLLFFAASSLGGLEEFCATVEADSPTSLWTLDHDFSSENATGRRALKRSQRGKSSFKNFPTADKLARAISLVVWIRDRSFVSHCSKSSVYQQTSVYRI